MGYSVGHWEGDTLVVESAGFNDRTWLDFTGHPHTEALKVTERFRRKDFGHMQLEITFNDPKAYTKPWTIAVGANFVADTELLEFVCNENEKDRGRLVGNVQDEKKTEVRVSAETLSKYVGTYRLGTARGLSRFDRPGTADDRIARRGWTRRRCSRSPIKTSYSRPSEGWSSSSPVPRERSRTCC